MTAAFYVMPPTPHRIPRPERIVRMVRYLEARRTAVSLETLAEHFDISPRQARRDVYVLESAGEPITYPRPGAVRYRR